MKFEITINNTENIEGLNAIHIEKIKEIVNALVQSGGLTGVRGGKTIIHFDAESNFMGIELDYWPWRKRKTGV